MANNVVKKRKKRKQPNLGTGLAGRAQKALSGRAAQLAEQERVAMGGAPRPAQNNERKRNRKGLLKGTAFN